MLYINFTSLKFKELNSENEFDKKIFKFINELISHSKMMNVQTSGSTGAPKIFSIEKERMKNSAKMTCDFLGLKKGDSALLCLPVEYISGKMMVVRAMERGLQLFVENPSSSPLKNLRQEIDFCAMTPLQVENSIDKIHLIKKLIIGGAAVSESLKKKIFQKLSEKPITENRQPPIIFETFGMSETLSHIALRQIYPEEQPYFTVLDGIKISTDGRGCLMIFAPQLNPETLQTNDLVEIKNEREFRFLGRIDNVINSGGAKIFPEELEEMVKKELDCEAVFIGIPDETLGEKLVLIIEGDESETISRQLSSIKYSRSFYRPKEIIFIEKIPRLPNGKIDRLSLKKNISNKE